MTSAGTAAGTADAAPRGPRGHRDRLTGRRRAAELAELGDMGDPAGKTAIDLLVVGGGVTGTGVALDAASRGLSVVLVERGDLASGTSRWSSKLIHGGLRYLATGDVHLAYESARERAVLMEYTAPHLVRALPFLVPSGIGTTSRDEHLVLAGARAAGALRLAARTRPSTLPGARRVSAAEALRWVPALRRDGLRGGGVTWDGQLEDDARLVIALARTAAAHGARVLTRVAAVRVDGAGARLRDEETGAELDVRARSVVNATGVWADTLAGEVSLRPSRGAHAVLRSALLGSPTAALMVPVPGEPNRYVFSLPQPDGTTYVGLTDEDVDVVEDVPTASGADLAFLTSTLSTALDVTITPADVVGSFAGLRPLVAGDAGRTADLSRRHLVTRGSTGVVTVVGGKLTTYRKMAEDAVDAAIAGAGLGAEPCRTRRLPLVGAASRQALARTPAPPRLVRRYGAEAPALVALADGEPGLLEPVAPGLPVLQVELDWGVLAEGARSVADLLERRTRLGLVPADADRARGAAEQALQRRGEESGLIAGGFSARFGG